MKFRRILISITAVSLLSACGKVGTSYSPNMMDTGMYGQQPYAQQGYTQPLVNGQPMGAQPVNGMNAGMNTGMAAQMPQQMAGSTPMNGMAQTAPQQAPQANNLPGVPLNLNGIPQQLQPGVRGPQRVSAPSFTNGPATTNNPPAPVSQMAPQGPAQPAQPAPQVNQAPAPQQAAPQVDPAQEYLNKMRQAFASIQGLDAQATTFEKGKTAGGGKIRYQFKKPGTVRIDVLQSDDPSRKGVKLSYQAGSTQVKARATGMLSLVAVTLPMSDQKVKSGRQYQLNQIDLTATISRITQNTQGAKAVGKTTINGSQVIVIEIPAHNHFDPQVTKERVGVDMQTGMLRMHEMYAGNDMVYAIHTESVKINPSFPANAFDI